MRGGPKALHLPVDSVAHLRCRTWLVGGNEVDQFI